MVSEKLFGREGKPWEGNVEAGKLSPSSYGAVAMFGVAELAVETLHEQGADITGRSVAELAKIFARILVRAQSDLGHGGWDSSLNMRLRGALRTALRVTPFDETDQDTVQESWRDWEAALFALVVNIAKTADWLHRLGPDDLGLSR